MLSKWRHVFWMGLLLFLWQLVAWSEVFSPLIFPSLSVVFKYLWLAIKSGEIVKEILFSLKLVLQGLGVGFFLAVIFVSLSKLSKTFEGFLETMTALAHPLPGIALLPLIILWFGTGTKSIIFIVIHSVVWPIVLNLSAGFKSIPQIYLEVGENFGLTRVGIIWNVMIPASLPFLMSGLRIGWARAWRALISAEMIFGATGGSGGLGWYIFKKRVFMDTPGLFAGLITIILVGLFVEYFIFKKLEKALKISRHDNLEIKVR
ncbi:MAG: ABC transporter permease [Dehalobacterium sp.]